MSVVNLSQYLLGIPLMSQLSNIFNFFNSK